MTTESEDPTHPLLARLGVEVGHLSSRDTCDQSRPRFALIWTLKNQKQISGLR